MCCFDVTDPVSYRSLCYFDVTDPVSESLQLLVGDGVEDGESPHATEEAQDVHYSQQN